MRRYVGLEVIAGTAQVGCKIDGRIDDEPVLAENIGQGFGRELFGCDGQFHWAVQGIGPLGRQDAVADVQGRLVQMDNTVFHLDIDIGRFDRLAAERAVADIPFHGDRRIVTGSADVNLTIQLACHILYGQGCHLEKAGNITIDDGRPAPQERRLRVIQQIAVIHPAELGEMKVRQAQQVVVIGEIAVDIV